MLTLRKRGRIWHIRGTVKVGRKSAYIEESTGTDRREAASAILARRQAEIETELLHGREATRRKVSFAESAQALAEKQIHRSDLYRLRVLLNHFGDTPISAIDAAAFDDFCKRAMPGRHPNTLGRTHTVLRACFRAVEAEGVAWPAIPKPKKKTRRNRVLTINQADRLITAYPAQLRIPGLLARYQGFRAGEIMRLDLQDIDFFEGGAGTIHIRETKTSQPRTVPMHPKVRAALDRHLYGPQRAIKMPNGQTRIPVCLNSRGQPWHDTRQVGGNPFGKPHKAACERVGIPDFTWHDWRHHWGTHLGRNGTDQRTLMELGGWDDPDSVSHYLAYDMENAAEKLARIG